MLNTVAPVQRPPWLGPWQQWVGYLAMVPLVVHAVLAASWFLGGSYPFAVTDNPESNFADHWLADLPARGVEGATLVGGALVVLVAFLMQHPATGALRRPLLAVGWSAAAFLVLVLPGSESLNNLPLLNLVHPRFSWPTIHLLVLMYAGLALGAATLAYQRATGPGCMCCGRHGRSWPRERWARLGRWASYTAFVAPFGYAGVRLLWTMGIPVGTSHAFLEQINAANPGHETRIMEWILASMAIGGGTLCLGLTQQWGEVWPRWLGGLAGKPVHPWLPVVAGAVAGQALFGSGTALVPDLLRFVTGQTVYYPATHVATTWLSHLPAVGLITWSVALLVAVVAYAHRTRPPCSWCGRGG